MANLECYNFHQKGHFLRDCQQPCEPCRNLPPAPVNTQSVLPATTGQQMGLAPLAPAPPAGSMHVLNVQLGGPENSCSLCCATNRLLIDCPNINQQLTAHLDVIEHLEAVPGMVLNMIQESAPIEGVQVQAAMDCAAAASACEAIFCQGSQKLLSLHAFGGINIMLYNTYFAARVKACDMHFDQIFFIVNNKLHPVLLGLPALIVT